MWHIDENVEEGFFPACMSRTADQPHACGLVTATPLFGPHHWTQTKLAAVAEGNPALNRVNPQDPSSAPYCEMMEITAYESNIVSHEFIENWKRSLDSYEIDARIYGRPAPQTKNPVFNRDKLGRLRELAKTPTYGTIQCLKPLEEVTDKDALGDNPNLFFQEGPGKWRIWEMPEKGAQYVLAVDSARGLTGRDASCASVLRLVTTPRGMRVRLAAQYHGWINSYDYGFEVFKGGVLFNSALVVVELTGGFGDAVLQVLTRTLAYWNIFRDDMGTERADPLIDPRMGVDTNPRTKPLMVGATQQLLDADLLEIYDTETLAEMANFEQEVSDSKKTVQFRGAKGAPDDRAMSVIIGCYVIVKYPVFDFLRDYAAHAAPEGENPHADIIQELSDEERRASDPFHL